MRHLQGAASLSFQYGVFMNKANGTIQCVSLSCVLSCTGVQLGADTSGVCVTGGGG